MFIGFFSVANTITVCGLISSVISCFLAANGNYKLAIYMMFIACLCDTFDGRIARSTANRTDAQKYYGVQLDSLCDVVSFGVTPCFIAFSFGFDGIIDVIIYSIFIACGATRLAYFNTLANMNPNKPNKGFRGVPIPMSTFVITILFVLAAFIPASICVWFFRIGLLALAIAFVLNIKIKKPNLKTAVTLIGIEVFLLLILLVAGDLKAPEQNVIDDTSETSIVETSK